MKWFAPEVWHLKGWLMEIVNTVIESFVAGYPQKQDFYRCAAEECREQCSEVLTQNGIRHISTQRAKSPDRLREKLLNRIAEGRNYDTHDTIEADIIDLAGTRVALYFPGELMEAVRVLEEQFNTLRKKEFPPKDVSRRGSEIYAYRFGGYTATHLLVKLKPETLEPKQGHLARTRIEIQVASVFMHAWAEVEHDLVYKPLKGESSITEYSLLDQINGLAHSGDLALELLQRALKERVARPDKRFQNHYELASHIHNIYTARESCNEPRMGRADLLLAFLRKTGLDNPLQLEELVKLMPTVTGREALVDVLAEVICRSEPGAELMRRNLWSALAQGDAALDSDALERRLRLSERLLKKHWQTFDTFVNQVLAVRKQSQLVKIASTGLDPALLKSLGFDLKEIDLLMYAHQGYIRVLVDQSTSSLEEIEQHTKSLNSAIHHLCNECPDVVGSPGIQA